MPRKGVAIAIATGLTMSDSGNIHMTIARHLQKFSRSVVDPADRVVE
jgi:hypothetical protein